MKKTIIAAVLGVVASIASQNNGNAQGFIFFGNYLGGLTQTAPVTYSGSTMLGMSSGQAVGNSTGVNNPTFTADLLVSFGANLGVTYTDLNIPTAFLGNNGDSVANGAGLFGGSGNQVSISGYTTGPVDFIIQVFSGADYASSAISGQSAVIALTGLATAANSLPTGSLFSGDNSAVTSGIQPFTVSPVPEPATLALAGLGGLASLVMLRRKQA